MTNKSLNRLRDPLRVYSLCMPPAARRTPTRRRPSPTLAGASSLSIFGSGRVNRFVNAVLRDNGYARDARNIHRDFAVATREVTKRSA